MGQSLGFTQAFPEILRQVGAEPDTVPAQPPLDDLIQAYECTAADEQDVGRVDLDEFLVGVLSSSLRRNVGNGPLQNLEQCLLYALSGDVAGDRRVLILAGDLIDFVDVDDPLHASLTVAPCGLEQLQDDVLDIFPDISGLGQRRGIDNRKRHGEHPGERLSKERLTRPGGTDQQNVAFGDLDFLVPALPQLDPLVVIVDRHGELLLGQLLTDHEVVEKSLDLGRLGQRVPNR